MKSPRTNAKWLLLSLAVVAVAAALALWFARRQTGTRTEAQVFTPSAPGQSALQTTPPPMAHVSALQAACDLLRSASNAAISRQQLAALRQSLAAMSANEAVAAIKQILDSKADTPTHLGFKLAANGLLDEAPTLRTFLLDELARLDPAAAAEYSRVILASMDSPDEWAVALRNLAMGDSSDAGRQLLAEKTAQLLQYAPWRQSPSVGYLEAFDVAVYLGGTSLLPTLSNLVSLTNNPAVAHASYLALDRLVINNPAAELAALESDPSLMQGRELTRANYFARADVRDPQQRQVLESYLLNPQIGAAEMNTFAGIYPNANFMISPNLLTPTPTPDHAALVSRDAESLAVAQQWLGDPRFASLQPVSAQIIQRLQGFLNQTAAGQ